MKDKLTTYLSLVLFILGNRCFIRPAMWLTGYTNLPATGDLILAMARNDMITRYGIEGLAMIKTFHDTYMTKQEQPHDGKTPV
jgi:hypothetical protein